MPSTYIISRRIFLRGLGVIYGIAFVSLGTQILGLVGAHGILPAVELLRMAGEQLGPERYWELPTLCWFGCGDDVLRGLCWAGTVASLLVIVDVAPAAALVVCWVVYLSLTAVGQVFLGYQWDALLLEAGFLAIFAALLTFRRGQSSAAPPPRLIVGLFGWLLFRLMVGSGLVKLASGDPVWRDFTALAYHYETQPLPTWIGWYMHQLPDGFQRASVVVMYLCELLAPFLIWGTPRLRLVGCAAIVGFQCCIMATGNYCFFNLLTIALCVWMIDDGQWRAMFFRCGLSTKDEGRSGAKLPGTRDERHHPAFVVLAAILIPLTTVETLSRFLRITWPRPIEVVREWAAPWQLANGYGLFADLTTERQEIVIEGSADGEAWLPYEFRWKPGDLQRRPGFVAPHQPRLDWQMWFAALRPYQRTPWFSHFLQRLLEGSPDVLGLLATNPFPDGPPQYVRALLYDYHFTTVAAKRADGAWWRRELAGPYSPVLSLPPK